MTGSSSEHMAELPMTQSRRGVVLPREEGSGALSPAARYALYALDDLTQITFAALADAVRMFSARGIDVPPAVARSRMDDLSARGLCEAVELALGDLRGDDRRVSALAGSFHVGDYDVVNAMRAPQLMVTAVGCDLHAALERVDRLPELGRSIAMMAVLDELRTRALPA
jgi:hypothetical protein